MATDISVVRDLEHEGYSAIKTVALCTIAAGGTLLLTAAGIKASIVMVIGLAILLVAKLIEWIRFGENYTKTTDRVVRLSRQMEELAVQVHEIKQEPLTVQTSAQ